MDRTRVSVIIPTYNRAHTLNRAIQSVFAQTFQDFELVIVDDASVDGTAEYLEHLRDSYGSKFEILVLQQPKNRGVSAARNLGIENSSGEWLAFLDSDDAWLPRKLDSQIKSVTTGGTAVAPLSDIRLTYTEEIWIRDGVRVNQMHKHSKSGGRIFKRCVDACFIAPSSALIRRDVFTDVGLFREDFPVCEDYELWLRIASGENVGFIEEPLIQKFGGHEDQLSRSMIGMDLWRVRALLPFLIQDFRGDWFADASLKASHVKDLLVGSENDFFSLITDDERDYVRQSVRQRLSILSKGALKHGNVMLQNAVREIDRQL